MPRTAVFLIDIQNDLAQDPKTEIPDALRIREVGAAILGRARAAIDTARKDGEQRSSTIVFVQHEEMPKNGPLVKGSKAWELVFQPRGGDAQEMVVAKTVGDTFESNPGLASQLRTEGIEHIVACGIQSECCVLETCKGALAAGFKVTLLKGGHSTYDGKRKSAKDIEREVEEMLERQGAEVKQWQEWQP